MGSSNQIKEVKVEESHPRRVAFDHVHNGTWETTCIRNGTGGEFELLDHSYQA